MAITINGTSGISGVDGSAGTPALQGSDPNTGISFGTDEVNINTGGTTQATVDSSGRVLVGTSTARTNMFNTPSSYGATLQVEGTTYNSSSASIITNSTTDNPVLFLARSKGTAVGSNTIVSSENCVGEVQFQANDGSEFVTLAAIQAYVDGTPGANDMPGRLVFSTTADGASSPTERMRITSNGALCVGTTSAIGSARFVVESDPTTINPMSVSNTRTSAGGDYAILFYRANSIVGSIQTTLSATQYITSSDYRLKKNIVPLTGAANRVNQLQVHRFNFIADPDTTVDGFIAHEAQAVVPEAVTGTHDEVDADGNPIYQGIDQSKLVPLLTAALQEALAKIETLETRLTALEGGAAQ